MTSPRDAERFYRAYVTHPADRVALFGTIADWRGSTARVLYPGSYVDIAPSVRFADVTYVDTDKRAARFFAQHEAVERLVRAERVAARAHDQPLSLRFHHQDYREPLDEPAGSFDLLVSLYAGFISEHCTDALAVGGTLLANPSHGDAAMASIDPRYRLSGVLVARDGAYRVVAKDLDAYLVPKRDDPVTVESLHASGRGVAYTKSAFAYLFTRVG